LFSATMPAEINTLARDILHAPVRVQIGHTAPAETVSHTFYPVEMTSKTALLQTILDTTETGLVLVFTRTKQRSKRVAQHLEASGYNAAALHGNLSQSNRQKAIQGFRDGRFKILVATDIAARGIDVCGVSHVINYDIPATADAYTHRIGRTGRACATGDAITFVSGEDRGLVSQIARILGSKLKYGAAKGFGGTSAGLGRPASADRHAGLRAAMPPVPTSPPRSRPASRYRPMGVSQRRPFQRAAKAV